MEFRKAMCDKYNLCFISLKPLGDNGTLVWNYNLNDSVWVLKQYAPKNSMGEVNNRMAKQQYDNLAGLVPEMTNAELKAFCERTFDTEIKS